MATGKRVLPGAPAAADHAAAAGRATTAERASRAEQAVAPGRLAHGRLGTGPAGTGRAGSARAGERVRSRLGRGAGGRWLVWTLRVVVWMILLLIGFRGVAAIVTGSPLSGGTATGTPGAAAKGFPVALARAYALDFGQVYLSYSPATATARAARLAAFVAPGTDPQFGWSGAGSQSVVSEHVAGVRVVSAHRAVVTLLAQAGGGRLFELGVPVYSSGGGLVVSGQPALLPGPAQDVPPATPPGRTDGAAAKELAATLPAFFRAYASGDRVGLSRLSADGARISGLGGSVTFDGIVRLAVPVAAGATRNITVMVRWRAVLPPGSPVSTSGPSAAPNAVAGLDMTYAITVVRRGAGWYVRSIGAAAAQPWPPS